MAYARTPVTVRAMKAGAVTVLDKSYAEDDLWDAIRAAISKGAVEQAERECRQDIRSRLASLNPDERRVLDMILGGMPNKAIAKELDVSLRTIENRRRQVFSKMQATSIANLILLVLEAEAEDQ